METSAVRAGAEGAGVLVPQPTAAFGEKLAGVSFATLGDGV